MSVVSLNERRKYPRVSDAVALCLDSDQSVALEPTPTHVVKISCGGLHFLHHCLIDANTRISLCMHLPSSNKTVHLSSRVISSGKTANGVASDINDKNYYVQVEFLDVDQSAHQLLADHISYVISKTGLSHRLAVPA